MHEDDAGHETIRLTEAGIRVVADFRQRNQRSLSPHDQLAARVAENLIAAGRIVWREVSFRARIGGDVPKPVSEAAFISNIELWPDHHAIAQAPPPSNASWRLARPDVFSVRRTTVEAYLQPMVHEIKISRADLLSDLRHLAKRESYQWLSCETYYVLPAGIAELVEIPEAFGIWLLNGPIETGTLELARAARHAPCMLPFAVWMTLATATPVQTECQSTQQALGETLGQTVEDAAVEAKSYGSSDR